MMNPNEHSIKRFLAAKNEYQAAEDELENEFKGFRRFLEVNDIEGAKNYLKDMPYCTTKGFMFDEIASAEQNLKND